MKLRYILALTAVLSMSATAAYAYSTLDTNQWIDGRGPVSDYSVITDHSGKKGVADSKGITIIDTIYSDIIIIPDTYKFAVQDKKGKWTIIDTSGRHFSGGWDYIDISLCDKGYICAGYYGTDDFNNSNGILNMNMELIVPPEYQTYIYTAKDGLLLGKLNNDTYTYYRLEDDNTLSYTTTLTGEIISPAEEGYYISSPIDCLEYNTDTEEYSQGYLTGLGLIDSNYNIIIPPVYENTSFSFNNGIAIVKKGSTVYEESISGKTGNGKYGLIDKKGNEIRECVYSSITRRGDEYTLTLDNDKIALTANALLGSKDTVTIIVNDTVFTPENTPVIEQDSLLLPLRDIANLLGADISWDQGTKTAVITKDNTSAFLCAYSDIMKLNNREISLPLAPVIRDNTLYVPVRSISLAFNCNINWDGTNRIVKINFI